MLNTQLPNTDEEYKPIIDFSSGRKIYIEPSTISVYTTLGKTREGYLVKEIEYKNGTVEEVIDIYNWIN